MPTPRARARDRRAIPSPDLPNPHTRSWVGVGTAPPSWTFTRADYEAWWARGALPRGCRLLWTGGRGESGYVLLAPPPRRVSGLGQAEEPVAEPGPAQP